jgi:hypothetical protein
VAAKTINEGEDLPAKVPAVDRTKLVFDLLGEDPQRSYRTTEVAKQI